MYYTKSRSSSHYFLNDDHGHTNTISITHNYKIYSRINSFFEKSSLKNSALKENENLH